MSRPSRLDNGKFVSKSIAFATLTGPFGTNVERASLTTQNVGISAVPTLPEHYRSKANECSERAKLASDPETKRQFELMARQWFALAKQSEKNGGC
jgi:hypothetical protein